MPEFSQILLAMVALPLVGALLILATSRLGIEHVRRMALTNVLLTFALSVVMVARYNPDLTDAEERPQLIQMTSAFPWTGPAPDELREALVRYVKERKLDAVTRADFDQFLSYVKAPQHYLESADRDFARLETRHDGSLTLAELTAVGPDVRVALGVDGLSLWLIALSALLMIPSVLVSWEAVRDRPAAFYALMLLLEAGLIGVFAAQDIILFYVFFEFTLIPLFFMVGIWGGHDRRWAARKFFIYTLAGSVLTFLGLIFIVLSHSWMLAMAGDTSAAHRELTFSIPRLTSDIALLVQTSEPARAFWSTASPWVFAALFAGFAIKVPLFPFHTWLPLAHVEAPTAGSVLLAGVLLKIGSYGFLRFALPLVPEGCWLAFDVVAILAVIGVIYGAFLALAQDDIKKLVAYSSVSHMGFCLLGLFALNTVGMTGGLLQMINHGLSTGALFAMVGMLYERYHTRDIEAYGGLARKFPVMTFFLMIIAFSSIGLPGLNGFTGEVLSLIGMFHVDRLYAILSLTGIIIGAWYMLWLVQRTFFGRLREPILEDPHGAQTGHGPASQPGHAAPADLNRREIFALAPIVVLIFWIGLYPQFFIRRMAPSIDEVARYVGAAHERLYGDEPVAVLDGPSSQLHESNASTDTRTAKE